LRLQLASSLLRLSLWGARDPAKLQAGAVPRSNFRRFRDKLEADFATQHQVQHYAQALGIGERSLSRLCLAVQGLSAKACVAQRLTLEAKRLLAHTTLSAQAIGGELGFDEATNFAKFFRKHTGMTPLAFRHAITDDGKLLSPLQPGHGPGPWPGTAPRPRV
jgi:AraC-like DNA-binding protein